MVGAINNFGWKYFKRLNRSENIFYSPYSIVAALSIAANGAIKATRRENFTNHDGSKSSVKMMNESFSYDVYFHSDENFKGIRLPYKDLTATMYLILPRSLTLKIISSKI